MSHPFGRSLQIVNNAEIASEDWRFLEGRLPGVQAHWTFHRAHPLNWLEHLLRRPNLARLRAAWQSAGACAGADALISHLPRTTLWTALMCGLRRRRTPHLAFSFNFTRLPGPGMKWLMRRAFRRVDRFVVYSTMEKSLYAHEFGIPQDHIDVLPWAMQTPVTGAALPAGLPARFACSVGGEGRDYATLVDAARRCPDIPLVIVARPSSLAGLDLPSHVTALSNVALDVFWSIVAVSEFVLIPLESRRTACGHISIVGSLLLDRPVVVTDSEGVADYVSEGRNALLVTPQDAAAMADRMRRLWANPQDCAAMGRRAGTDARRRHDPGTWEDYLAGWLKSLSAR